MDYAKLGRGLHEFMWTFTLRHVIHAIKRNLSEDSFFPELARKSAARRLAENLAWFLRHGEVNSFYNSYGFDVKGLRDQRQYLPDRKFRIERYNANLYLRSPYAVNRVCILRDKSLFAMYMGAALGRQHIAHEIGVLRADGSLIPSPAEPACEAETLTELLLARQEDLFIKKLAGECGAGCYLIKPIPQSHEREVNGSAMKPEALAQEMLGSEYIIQKRLVQHEQLSLLNPSCVNTVRIITIINRKTGEPRIFAHFLRLGINSVVDNRATGGLAVLIDENGVLRGKGFGHHRVYTEHPVTKKTFDGFQIPYWPEVQQLVTRAHSALKDIPSIGWDVAITPEGPVLLEGNDDWELCGVQDTRGGVKARWREFNE